MRGKGTFLAFSLPTQTERDTFMNQMFERGILFAGCGTNSVRLRPCLLFNQKDVDTMKSIINTHYG